LENFNITSSVDGPIVNIDGLDAACSHNTILNNNFASNCNYAEDDILEISGSLSNIVEGNQLVIAPSLVAYGDWAGIIVDFGSDGTVVNNNTVRGGYIGIGVFFADNVTVSNNYVTEQTLNNSPVLPELDGALDIEESSGDLVKGNTLMNNTIGLFLGFDVSNCALYHNNFIDNAQQVSISDLTRVTLNSWDNGYPYGGNYWSDYGGTDFYSGPYQNVTGSDGIGDTPYTIAINNVDDYPLMEPWDSPPTFTASVSVYPNVLNLQSKGTWVTFHIKLPAGYDVADINVSTIMLNSTVPAESTPTSIEDNNSVPDLIVTFNRTELVNFMVSENIIFDNVTLTVAGQLYDGTNFIGTSTIQVSSLMGDINCDGKISLSDLALLVKAYGSHPGDPDWNDNANFVEPYNRICLSDLCTVAVHYGQHEP
jgi:parallel beta-helix repeat protein